MNLRALVLFLCLSLVVVGQNPPSGSVVVAAPPYILVSGSKYIPMGMQAVTGPTLTGFSFLGTQTSTNTTHTNGDVGLVNTSGNVALYGQSSLNTSIELIGNIGDNATGGTSNSSYAGAYIYDSTNGKIYAWAFQNDGNAPTPKFILAIYTFSGTGNPTFSSVPFENSVSVQPFRLRMVRSATSVTLTYSIDGGQSYLGGYTFTVGTISSMGVYVGPNSTLDLLSLQIS